MARNGVGRHFLYLSPDQATKSIEYLIISQPPATLSTCFGKISVALLLLRIMNRIRAQAWFLWFIIISNLLIVIVFNIVEFTRCTPVQYIWNKSLSGGQCIVPDPLEPLGYLQGGESNWAKISPVIVLLTATSLG